MSCVKSIQRDLHARRNQNKQTDQPALDYAVAKCEDEDYVAESGANGIGIEYEATSYSTNWSQGGPIIERELIESSRQPCAALIG